MIPSLDDLPTRRGLSGGVLRDVLAIILIVLGATAMITVAFLIDVHLGVTALGVTALLSGLLLGSGR